MGEDVSERLDIVPAQFRVIVTRRPKYACRTCREVVVQGRGLRTAHTKESQLARALRELGRIERSLFMIEWYSSLALRRRCEDGLNKGEATHKLKRAVLFHERGEIRDRSFESQAFRASGLNLVVSAIVHWNTVYIERAVSQWRKMLREDGRAGHPVLQMFNLFCVHPHFRALSRPASVAFLLRRIAGPHLPAAKSGAGKGAGRN